MSKIAAGQASRVKRDIRQGTEIKIALFGAVNLIMMSKVYSNI